MAETGVFVTNSMLFPIKIGGINYINFFSRGSIEMSGTNIFCHGESLRLYNGKVNKNMLQSHHLSVYVHKTHLTATRGNVIHPEAQTIVGLDTEDHGQYKDRTIIWNLIDPKNCNLLRVTDMEFSSVQAGEIFSKAHTVQFSVTSSFYDDNCKIMITNGFEAGP